MCVWGGGRALRVLLDQRENQGSTSFKLLTTVLTLLFYCQVVSKIQMSHHRFTKKPTSTWSICRGRQFQFFSGRTDSFTILCQYHGFMKLAQKNCRFLFSFKWNTSTCTKRVCTFCKKKTWCAIGFLQTCKKTFFFNFKKCETTPLFFSSNFQEFSGKVRKQKHNFHFQIAKILDFVHKKKVFFYFTIVHRLLLNSHEISFFSKNSQKNSPVTTKISERKKNETGKNSENFSP